MRKSLRKHIVQIPFLIIECNVFQNGVWADQATTFPSDESLHARKYSSPKNTPQLLKDSHSLPKDAFCLTPRSKSVSSSPFAPAKMENIPKSRGDHFCLSIWVTEESPGTTTASDFPLNYGLFVLIR